MIVLHEQCERFKEIMFDAPWSVFDLLSGCILFLMGAYLLCSPRLFESWVIYEAFKRYSDEWELGIMLLVCGVFSVCVALWKTKPSFEIRLLARVCVSFHFITLAINNIASSPPILSSVTYIVLSLFSMWAVLRTQHVG